MTQKSCDKNAYTFTREQSTLLIMIYEQYPVLYDVQNEEYKNKTKRYVALKSVQTEFQERFNILVNLEDIRKKINSLRTQFFAELGKVKKSLITGTGADDVYVPTLWCYEQLSFLNSSKRVRTGESNLQVNSTEVNHNGESSCEVMFDGTVEELSHFNAPSSPARSPSRPSTSSSFRSDEDPKMKKMRKTGSLGESKAINLLEKATTLLVTTNSPQVEQPLGTLDAFAVTVAADLKQIKNPALCRRVRRKITEVIHNALEIEEENEEA